MPRHSSKRQTADACGVMCEAGTEQPPEGGRGHRPIRKLVLSPWFDRSGRARQDHRAFRACRIGLCRDIVAASCGPRSPSPTKDRVVGPTPSVPEPPVRHRDRGAKGAVRRSCAGRWAMMAGRTGAPPYVSAANPRRRGVLSGRVDQTPKRIPGCSTRQECQSNELRRRRGHPTAPRQHSRGFERCIGESCRSLGKTGTRSLGPLTPPPQGLPTPFCY